MASAYKVTASTTPQVLVSGTGYTQAAPKRAIVRVDGATTVYVGGADVDSTDGFSVAQNGSVEVEAFGDQDVWVVTASSTSVVSVLASGD